MNTSDIKRMLEVLKNNHNVISSKEFKKDLCVLFEHPSEKFIKNFSYAFMKKDFNSGKFEIIKDLTKEQIDILDGNKLCRYEYRENKNLRCIFCTNDEYNNVILLCAFVEDNNKKKGPDSYASNISRAIRIYSDLMNRRGIYDKY